MPAMRSSPESSEGPILNLVGERVALGPSRRGLVPTYQRWFNDLGTLRTLNVTPRPLTHERELAWHERQARAENTVEFTVYELANMRPIGTATLASIDHRNGTANFAVVIGEPGYRGKGYGTEAIRLTLDHAFIALGLRNVLARVLESNAASLRAHEKAGFREFGRRRRCRVAGGRKWDEVHMECLSTGFERPVTPGKEWGFSAWLSPEGAARIEVETD